MSTLSEVLRILWLIFLWFCFSFIALVSLAMVVIGGWPWGAMFFVAGPVFLAVIDMAHSESIGEVKQTAVLSTSSFSFLCSSAR